jgi:hypothetical protein
MGIFFDPRIESLSLPLVGVTMRVIKTFEIVLREEWVVDGPARRGGGSVLRWITYRESPGLVACE